MNEKKKLRRLPKRILSFVLTLTMILTLLPISSTIVYADTLQIPNDATIIEEDYRKDDAGSFYLYLVDKNGNEELYGKLFYDRFVSTKTIMLSTDIKSVRLVKDSGYEVNLDQLTLNGIAPNGFERKLSKTDKDLIELENVLTFELQGKGNLVISARAPKTVSDESMAVKFPNSNFMKTITMDSECYTYDMDSNVCTLSNVKIVPDKSNLFKSVIAYPGSGHPVAPIDYYVANDDDYLYIYSEVFGDNTLDHGKDHSGIYVLCDDEVKYYAVYTTEENEYGYWDFTYTNSRLEYDYQHMTYLVKIPRADILDAGNSVKLVFEYYGTLSGHLHEWEYRSEGSKIIATCNGWGECDANNGKAEISLIAEPQNYSGDSCSFSKADIFGETDFETFNTATENSLSVSDIKIYATDNEGNKTGSAIDLVTSKGQYIAELECEIPDYSSTHSASICNEEHGYGSGVIEIKKVWGSWWTSKGDTAGYCSLQEGDRIESLNINLSGGGEVYLDNVALTENRENVSAKIVKLDGDKIYLCANHDASVNNICTTCGYGDKLNPVAKIVFDVTQNHAHGSWTYQTDGATLTATCGVNGCELPNSKVSLTLTATSQNYSGSEVSASYDTEEVKAWKAATGKDAPEILYYLADGTTPTNEANSGAEGMNKAPKNVGSYVAKATVNFMTLKMTVEFEEGVQEKAVMKEVLKNCKKVEDDCEIYI